MRPLTSVLWLALGCTEKGAFSGGDDTGVAVVADEDGDGFDSVDQGGEDCDDTDPAVNPAAAEVCNGIDDNCDGLTDDPSSADAPTWYADSDADGFGSASDTTTACSQPTGYLDDASDCDDADPDLHPGALEVCNGVDDDCDGRIDDDDPDVLADTWYRDSDGDGYGDAAHTLQSCAAPLGYVIDDTDCDDGNPNVYPGAAEACNDIDDDCDPTTGEDGIATTDGLYSFTSIQDAIDAAVDGSTVVVCDGTYTGALQVPVDLTLTSKNGASVTTIDAGGRGAAILAGEVELHVEGFTITGGTGATSSGSPTVGGGISAGSTTSLKVTDCVVDGNSANYGGGIVGSVDGTTRIVDSVISNNTADEGGGLFLAGASILDGVEITNNTASYGAGVTVSGGKATTSGSTTVHDNAASTGGGGVLLIDGDWSNGTVENNTADRYCGGIWVDGDANLDSMSVNGNEAPLGGGVCVVDSGTVSFTAMTIVGNTADSAGGGLYVAGSALTAAGSTINGNDGGDYGGGIWVSGDGSVALMSSMIMRNTASSFGGGAFLYSGALYSSSSSWGGGTSDNDPDDVAVYDGSRYVYSYSSYTSSETFTCRSSTARCN